VDGSIPGANKYQIFQRKNKDSKKGGEEMNLQGKKEIARQRGLKAGKMKKSEIIRTIQETEDSLALFQDGGKIK
jgi:hypothetical protein